MAFIRFRSTTNNFWLGFFIFLIVGTIFICLGWYMLSGNLEMTKNGVLTKATVVEMSKHTSSKSVSYKPVMEFTTSTGEIIRTESTSGSSNPNSYAIGEEVSIYYSKDNPNNILIDRFMDKYGFPAIFMFAGALAVFIALVMAIQKIRYAIIRRSA